MEETIEAGPAQTFQEFKAEQAKPPEVEKVEATPKVEAEVVADEEKPAKRPPATVPYERLSEAAAKTRAAEERAAAAERERDELRAKIAPPPVAKPAPVEGEPKPEHFADAFQFAAALAEFKVGKAMAERDAKEVEKVQQAERGKVATAFAERVTQTKVEMPDYDDVVGPSEVIVSNAVRDALIKSPVGPKLLYKLASDPALAAELYKMDPIDQLMQVGEWASDMKKPKVAEKPARETVRAPAPITPVRGTRGADVPVDSDGEFTGTYQEFKRLSAAGKL